MIELRIKECCKAHGITQKELASRLGIKPISLSQMIARKGFSIERLGEMADAIGCKVSELFEEEEKSDFAAFVRYKGIHWTADNLDDWRKVVDEVNTIAK